MSTAFTFRLTPAPRNTKFTCDVCGKPGTKATRNQKRCGKCRAPAQKRDYERHKARKGRKTA